MALIVLVLVLLGFSSVCGQETQPPKIIPKVIGGEETDVSVYPYQLSLQYFGLHSCGASLIAPRWVLTAAHCLDKTLTSFLSVRAGATGRERGGLVVDIANKYVHQKYNPKTIDYDMALLELDDPIDSEYAEAIPLPTKEMDVVAGDIGTITGWGSTSADGAMVDMLRVVEIPVLSHYDCRRVLGNGITDRMFCAGYVRGGRDSCQGDSGGPFIVNGRQMGIVSWGYGCAKPYKPGVYTNVAKLRDFIWDVAGI